jgi:hypothetical protein
MQDSFPLNDFPMAVKIASFFSKVWKNQLLFSRVWKKSCRDSGPPRKPKKTGGDSLKAELRKPPGA